MGWRQCRGRFCLAWLWRALHLEGEDGAPRGFSPKTLSLELPWCPHLQKGAVPEATPDMQDCGAVKAVERAAEHHTISRALGAVLGRRVGRTLRQQARELTLSPVTLI